MKALNSLPWILLTTAIVYGAEPARTVDPAKPLVLANDFVLLEFEPETRGLVSLTDQQSHTNHIQPVEGRPPEAASAITSSSTA